MDPIGIVLISVIGALIVVCLVFLGIFMHKRKFKINSLNLRKTYDDYHTQLTTDCANMVSRLKVLGRSNEYFYTMYCERQKQYDDILNRRDHEVCSSLDALDQLVAEKKYKDYKEVEAECQQVVSDYKVAVCNFNSDLTSILQDDNDVHSNAVTVKAKYRQIHQFYDEHVTELKPLESSFERIFSSAEAQFDQFDKDSNEADFVKAKDILENLNKLFTAVLEVLKDLPMLEVSVSAVLPQKLDLVLEEYNKMLDEGFVVAQMAIGQIVSDMREEVGVGNGAEDHAAADGHGGGEQLPGELHPGTERDDIVYRAHAGDDQRAEHDAHDGLAHLHEEDQREHEADENGQAAHPRDGDLVDAAFIRLVDRVDALGKLLDRRNHQIRDQKGHAGGKNDFYPQGQVGKHSTRHSKSICNAPGRAPRSAGSDEPDLFIDLAQGLVGDIGGLLRAAAAELLEIGLVLHDAPGLLADGTQRLDDGLAHGGLEDAVALTVEFLFDLLKALAGHSGVDAHEVGHARLLLGRVAHATLRITVGHGALELAHDVRRVVHEADAAVADLIGL